MFGPVVLWERGSIEGGYDVDHHGSPLTGYAIVHEVHLEDDLTVRRKTAKPKRREAEIVCQLSGRQLSSFRGCA